MKNRAVFKKVSRGVFALIILMLASGCAPRLPELQGDKTLFSFLEEGLTREEIILSLGTPSASFEDEHIFTYRVAGDEEQGYLLSDRQIVYGHWGIVSHSLVLVFNQGGKLEKYKLVKVQ